MTPGPVSDSYDPVWGTAANAQLVRDGIYEMKELLSQWIVSEPKFILDVIRGDAGPAEEYIFTERELRILRFACRVALEEDRI